MFTLAGKFGLKAGFHIRTVFRSFKSSCIKYIAIEPLAPAADPPLVESPLTSPASKTPGWLVSSKKNWCLSLQCTKLATVVPVIIKPFSSSPLQPDAFNMSKSLPNDQGVMKKIQEPIPVSRRCQVRQYLANLKWA